MDAEFVDLSFVQKRSDDLATSHHPNVLTGLRPQALREWLDQLFYQLESRQQRPLRLAGKEVVLDLWAESSIFHAHLNSFGVRLSPPHDGIDALHESAHSVVSLPLRTVQP